MTTADRFLQQIAEFPAPLRELVEAEIDAGNSIVAIESGFPAAPCGASVKLAKAVQDQRRRSEGAVNFYARNNASYAGEFTTEQRHYFVLEPPLPPAPEPDMDAIRMSLEPKPELPSSLSERESGTGLEFRRALLDERPSAEIASARARALSIAETATSARRLLRFIDHRPPHEIQYALERDLLSLFAATIENDRLLLTAKAKVAGARYDFSLRFEAATAHHNFYSFCAETSWADAAATHHDYYRHSAGTWFDRWTRDLQPAELPAEQAEAGALSPERYRRICAASLNAEAHLDSVPALQRTIVAAMKRGARFSTSHKEGGTKIGWNGERFVRSDYGDHPDRVVFHSDVDFLEALRRFFDWEISQSAYPERVSDLVAWRLLLRLMRT